VETGELKRQTSPGPGYITSVGFPRIRSVNVRTSTAVRFSSFTVVPCFGDFSSCHINAFRSMARLKPHLLGTNIRVQQSLKIQMSRKKRVRHMDICAELMFGQGHYHKPGGNPWRIAWRWWGSAAGCPHVSSRIYYARAHQTYSI